MKRNIPKQLIMKKYLLIGLLMILGSFKCIYNQVFIKEYNYFASENDSKNSARDAALVEVKKLLMEEMGVYVQNVVEQYIHETDDNFYESYSDKTEIVQAFITKTEILEEKWDGKTFYLKAKITVDDRDVYDQLNNRTKRKKSRNKIERVPNGEIDWDNKVVVVKGFGVANKSFPEPAWQKSAEEAAKVDAQVKLLELVDGFDIHSRVFVESYQVTSDVKIKEIKGRLQYVQQLGDTYYPNPETAEVYLFLKLDDVLD